MAVNSILSAASEAACTMFREAVAATKVFVEAAKGAFAGLTGAVKFSGQVATGTQVTANAVGGAGPPGQQHGKA